MFAAGLTGRQKADSALTAAVRAHLPPKPLKLTASPASGYRDQPGSARPRFSGAAAARAARAAISSYSGGGDATGALQQSRASQLHSARGSAPSAADDSSSGLAGQAARGPRTGAPAAAAARHADPPEDHEDDLEDDFDDWVETGDVREEDWRAELRAITGYDPSRWSFSFWSVSFQSPLLVPVAQSC